jgi:uncharacterized protein
MKEFFKKHLFLSSIAILVLTRIVGLTMFSLISMFNKDLTIQDLGWLIQIIFASVTVLAVLWLGIQKRVGLSYVGSLKNYVLLIPVLIFPVYILFLFGVSTLAWSTVMVLFVSAVGVAINEEILYRGVMLESLLSKGVLPAILVQTVIFGVTHLGNVLVGGDLKFAIIQVVWTIIGGIALGLIRLAMKSVWPVILIHFIVDFTEYIALGEIGVHSIDISTMKLIGFVIINIIFIFYAYFIYKKQLNPVETV